MVSSQISQAIDGFDEILDREETDFVQSGLKTDHAVAEGKAEERDAKRWKADTTSNPQQRVNVILRKLREPVYRNFLRTTFGPRKGPDGRRYTATHAALLRLPFRAYVTTNYDPALDFARAALRPDSLSTGTPTWEDDDVYRWRTGGPMLWIHGYWQRPAGIVLNSGEYSQAYKPGIYRNTFKELWVRERLAFLGFGFNDPQFTFMVGEFLRDLGEAHAVPRHVAILGLPVEKDGRLPDTEAVREWRESLEADYHVRVLFYPVPDGNHSALQVLLEHLAERCRCDGLAFAAPPLAPATTAAAVADKWVHETSNDEKFTGRNDEIARLDRWVRDAAVRVCAVCAVGGTGKTALIGHWLKQTVGWRSKPFAGLFAWSFYQDRDTKKFLEAFLEWARETFRMPKPKGDTMRVVAALAVLRTHTLVLMLDGLEVLQEGLNDARYGSFLDGDLRELLAALCHHEPEMDAVHGPARDHESLAVLTSRFVFADLDRFLGAAFHQLELHGLAPDNGARLLEELGVRGPAAEREHVSGHLDGHPLGLRVFADALSEEDRGRPRRFLDHSFHVGGLPEGTSLNDKLRRLLVFYEKKLPVVQVRILGIVSLFRAPVADETVPAARPRRVRRSAAGRCHANHRAAAALVTWDLDARAHRRWSGQRLPPDPARPLPSRAPRYRCGYRPPCSGSAHRSALPRAAPKCQPDRARTASGWRMARSSNGSPPRQRAWAVRSASCGTRRGASGASSSSRDAG